MPNNDPNFRSKGSSAQKQVGLLGVIFKLLPFFTLKPCRHGSTCCAQLLQGAAERKSFWVCSKALCSSTLGGGGKGESGQSPQSPADVCEILALRPPKGFGKHSHMSAQLGRIHPPLQTPKLYQNNKRGAPKVTCSRPVARLVDGHSCAGLRASARRGGSHTIPQTKFSAPARRRQRRELYPLHGEEALARGHPGV